MDAADGAAKGQNDTYTARSLLRSFRAAVALLTRLPVGGFPYSARELAWSSAHLPLVGALLGSFLGFAWTLLARGGSFLGATAVITLSLLLTGALHEDGLADTADALGGATTREQVFIILKDSRIGTFGAAALAASLLLRVSALVALQNFSALALVLAHSVSRLVPVCLMATLPYVSAMGAKSAPHTRVGIAHVAVAVLWCAAVVFGLLWRGLAAPEAASALLSSALCAVLLGWRFVARAGGVTGDFLGASQQVSECCILVSLALWRGHS